MTRDVEAQGTQAPVYSDVDSPPILLFLFEATGQCQKPLRGELPQEVRYAGQAQMEEGSDLLFCHRALPPESPENNSPPVALLAVKCVVTCGAGAIIFHDRHRS